MFLKAYAEPTASYQPVYAGHQQGVVVQQGGTVTTIVTSQTVQQVCTQISEADGVKEHLLLSVNRSIFELNFKHVGYYLRKERQCDL